MKISLEMYTACPRFHSIIWENMGIHITKIVNVMFKLPYST